MGIEYIILYIYGYTNDDPGYTIPTVALDLSHLLSIVFQFV